MQLTVTSYQAGDIVRLRQNTYIWHGGRVETTRSPVWGVVLKSDENYSEILLDGQEWITNTDCIFPGSING